MMAPHRQPPVSIVGVAETISGRSLPQSSAALAVEAIQLALADAGLNITDLNGIVTEGSIMPALAGPDVLISSLGLSESCFTAQIGVGGSGTAAAPILAGAAIDGGLASVVACVFVSKFGTSPGGPYAIHEHDPYKASLELPFGFFPQPVYFATLVNRYLAEYKADAHDLRHVAMSTRAWAARHPLSLKKSPITDHEYDRSPVVSDPLRVLDCCLVNDGAAAFIMTSRQRARDCRQRAVSVTGCARSSAPFTGYSAFSQRGITTQASASAPRAYAQAGITAADANVVELYDCFTITPVLQLEDMGFAELGGALDLFRSGATAPGGDLPVNTNGGLLSNSYLAGIGHVVEAVHQVRGTAGPERQVAGAEIGVVGGFTVWEHTTMVLAQT
jgi:acetyl-CoA acetyltransferase